MIFLKKLFEGWLLSIHMDTRAIEFNSGIIAILIGLTSIMPSEIFHSNINHLLGIVFIVWGVASSTYSCFGPFTPRKYLALFGVYFWIFVVNYLFTNNSEHNHIVGIIPYILIIGSSFFTYLGLWRVPSKWNYYYEPPTTNRN